MEVLDLHVGQPSSIEYEQIDAGIFLPYPYWNFVKMRKCATDRLIGLFQDHCFSICWFVVKMGDVELRIHPRCDLLGGTTVINLCTKGGVCLTDIGNRMSPGFHHITHTPMFRLGGKNLEKLYRKIHSRLFKVWAEHCIPNDGILNGPCWFENKSRLKKILEEAIIRKNVSKKKNMVGSLGTLAGR